MKIQELSISEKVLLAQELWDSVIFDQGALDITPDQRDELDRRLSEFELDGDQGSSWSEVKGRILKS